MSKSDQISGNQKRKSRSATRLYIIQALFQMEQLGQSIDQVAEEFIEHRFGAHYEVRCPMEMKLFLSQS